MSAIKSCRVIEPDPPSKELYSFVIKHPSAFIAPGVAAICRRMEQ